MATLYNPAVLGQRRICRIRTAIDRFGMAHAPVTLVGAIALAAALLVLGAIVLNGFSGNAFRLGSQMGWRFTSFVFFAVLVVAPLARLTGHLIPSARRFEEAGPDLIWGFCASYGVYLLSVLLPNAVQLSMGALLFVLFGAFVITGMTAAAAPLRLTLGGAPLICARVRRTILGTAMTYFWLCYSLLALDRISGPHRPDPFYNISLLLMISGLLVRFFDRWVEGSFRDT